VVVVGECRADLPREQVVTCARAGIRQAELIPRAEAAAQRQDHAVVVDQPVIGDLAQLRSAVGGLAEIGVANSGVEQVDDPPRQQVARAPMDVHRRGGETGADLLIDTAAERIRVRHQILRVL